MSRIKELENELDKCRLAHLKRSRTIFPDYISPSVAFRHYVAEIICDHESKRDRVRCSCSRVNLGWHSSVGQAIQSWVDHAVDETRKDRFKEVMQSDAK